MHGKSNGACLGTRAENKKRIYVSTPFGYFKPAEMVQMALGALLAVGGLYAMLLGMAALVRWL